MDRDFLQLRGQGCKGMWEIFLRARDLADKKMDGEHAANISPGPRLALFLTSGEAWQRPLWEESARCAHGSLIVGGDVSESGIQAFLAANNVNMAVVGGMPDADLKALAGKLSLPVINAGNSAARPCQVMADMLALVRLLGPAADDIGSVRVSWIGGADGDNAGFVNSWLDMVLCFQHELFLAFPQGREPEPDPLDFAMNAGGKIFLSYDPAMVTEGAHCLVAAPWFRPEQGVLTPRHPLTCDSGLVEAAAGIPVFSLTVDMADSKSLRAEREHCLAACQTALLEYLTARPGAD